MNVRLMLGPAGSGKTHRCLEEVRTELKQAPEGLPLLFIAPKQATFQLERQLLQDPELGGYTRLQVLSFERLARMVWQELGGANPQVLDEQGRLMVFRALLEARGAELDVFHATARLPGFVQHVSRVVQECQQQQITSNQLRTLSESGELTAVLRGKIRDVARLQELYLEWLEAHSLRDAYEIIANAVTLVKRSSHQGGRLDPTLSGGSEKGTPPFRLGGLWMDGFAEVTPQELDLLSVLVPVSARATLAFCLPGNQEATSRTLSCWSGVAQSVRALRLRLAGLAEVQVEVVELGRDPQRNRFAARSPLAELERRWDALPRVAGVVDEAGETRESSAGCGSSLAEALQVWACPTPEQEVVLTARQILQYLREDNSRRFRDLGVVLRSFDGYYELIRRVFRRYQIPIFLDRREPVAHHPLAELTRYALRVATFHWRHDDWFGSLKTGLVPIEIEEVDALENAALAHGWEGSVWGRPLPGSFDDPERRYLERIRSRAVKAFASLTARFEALGGRATGLQLAEILEQFWGNLQVEACLHRWAAQETDEVGESRTDPRVHQTVWDQMKAWLGNLERAFPDSPLSLPDWMPIVETGLGSLSIGVIPLALDQVMIGTIDRSRNPDLRRVWILGMNEGVFPCVSFEHGVLSEQDRDQLETVGLRLSTNLRGRLSRERYFAYIACTRARERVVLTYAETDLDGRGLNVSSYVDRLREIFPELEIQQWADHDAAGDLQHPSELVAPLIDWCQRRGDTRLRALLSDWPLPEAVRERIGSFASYSASAVMAPEMALKLYGPVLRTSVSALESYAACPFQFLVRSGLRAQERVRFEPDARERGSFQHALLAAFHRELGSEGKRWRDLAAGEARRRVERLGEQLLSQYNEGLWNRTPETRFEAEQLRVRVADYLETAVYWMAQYAFDPYAVELGFGRVDDPLPAWEIKVDPERTLACRGIVDRVDLATAVEGKNARGCVILDYKAGNRKVDPLLMQQGIQLQLPFYLAAVCRLVETASLPEAPGLIPVGFFFINLKGAQTRVTDRREALNETVESRREAYRHSGRFDREYLNQLDGRPGVSTGDQFNYRRSAKSGELHRGCREPMASDEFRSLLRDVETQLRSLAQAIFQGNVQLDPYRYQSRTPCDYCEARNICRIDPWTHRYRLLGKDVEGEERGDT